MDVSKRKGDCHFTPLFEGIRLVDLPCAIEERDGRMERKALRQPIPAHYLAWQECMSPVGQVTLQKAATGMSSAYCSTPRGSGMARETVPEDCSGSIGPSIKGRRKKRNDREENLSLSCCRPLTCAEEGMRRQSRFCFVVWSAF